MQTISIDLSPQVRHYEAYGRQKLADVHFRIENKAYTISLNDRSREAREAGEKAVQAFDDEVVELLKKDGWKLRSENYGPGSCPQLTKDAQYLYCHPHDISGSVNVEDVERLEKLFRSMKSCGYRWTDNYGDVIVTTSEADEYQLYLDYYPMGIATTMQHYLTTKRRDLYKDKGCVEHAVCNCIAIQNRRIDLDEIDCGSPHMRKPLCEFVVAEYDRLLKLGYIRESKALNGQRTLARWANKAEIREIEKKCRTQN